MSIYVQYLPMSVVAILVALVLVLYSSIIVVQVCMYICIYIQFPTLIVGGDVSDRQSPPSEGREGLKLPCVGIPGEE